MSKLERAIMLMIWEDVQGMPNIDVWRKYERGFTYENKKYRYKCRFRVQDGHLRLIDTSIEHEQVVIELVH